MVELIGNKTQIYFEMIPVDSDKDKDSDKNKDNDNKKDEEDVKDGNKGLSALHIALISIFGSLLILIILILAIRYFKRRKKVDIIRQTKNLSEERLLEDI